METTITKLADFISSTTYETLPAEVVHQVKRQILDAVGCALAGKSSDKGKWGIDYVRRFYGGSGQATVIGYVDKVSAMGASFANGELINGLDYDAAGKHLPPFVIPPAFAMAELNHRSGKDLITALAVALETGMRIGGALGSYRDVNDGKTSLPPVTGHACAIFGGAAGVTKLDDFSKHEIAHSLGMAGLISTCNTQTPMHKDLPTNTGKYLMAGWAAQSSLTAPYLIKSGHRGDIQILDGEYGYWRFSGSSRWNSESVVKDLGERWIFPRKVPIKQYPCCRMMHGGLDCLQKIILENNLKPEEITEIHAYLEATCAEPVFHGTAFENQMDFQFSPKYNMAMLAFNIRPFVRWQDPDMLHNPEVRRFMDKITFEPHPGYANALVKDNNSRLSKVVVKARGQEFSEETTYIKGTITDDPKTGISDEELIQKFRENASRVLSHEKVDALADALMNLENCGDFAEIVPLLS